ncbi:MAG: MASE1 domain-containing protein, partial [Mycobacteriales bacterium]
MPASARRWWLRQAGVAAGCYGAAQLGLLLALNGREVVPLWPQSGVALVALLLWGRRVLPAVAVAALAVDLPLLGGALSPLVATAGAVLGPLVGAALLRRSRFDLRMRSLRDLVLLLLVALPAMVLSASLGTAALLLDRLDPSDALTAFTTWWAGDAVGVLVVTPFLL